MRLLYYPATSRRKNGLNPRISATTHAEENGGHTLKRKVLNRVCENVAEAHEYTHYKKVEAAYFRIYALGDASKASTSCWPREGAHLDEGLRPEGDALLQVSQRAAQGGAQRGHRLPTPP